MAGLKIKTKLSFAFSEIIFVIYFWGFILIRPLLQAFESKSTLILFIYVVLLLSIFVVHMIIRRNLKLGEAVFFILMIFGLFLIDAVFRNNSYSFIYLYKFIYCGIIPVLLLSKVRNVQKLLFYFSWLSLVVFILFWSDPINGFNLFSSYMDYGFNLVLPAFIGLFIGYFYFKIRWMIVFVIASFFCILIFANRSSLLSVLIFMILYFVILSPNRKKVIMKWVLPFSFVILLMSFNIKSIVQYIYNIVVFKLEINSYALNKFTSYFAKSTNADVYSGRIGIWIKANTMIKENIVFGHGIGSFQNRYGFYSHNIYLDLLLFFGIIGLIWFLILILYSIWKILLSSQSSRILGFVFFALWFPKLLFSTYFLEDIGFWCFLSFPFISKYFVEE